MQGSPAHLQCHEEHLTDEVVALAAAAASSCLLLLQPLTLLLLRHRQLGVLHTTAQHSMAQHAHQK
jgi:hypothetical protein